MTISNTPSIPQYFDSLRSFAVNRNFFSDEECDKIIKLGYDKIIEPAYLSSKEQGVIDENIRKARVSFIDEYDESEWLFAKLQTMITQVNSRFFKYHIECFESLQFTVYDEPGDHYEFHSDCDGNSYSELQRKLSFSVQLSHASDYEGGELELYSPNKVIAPQERGSLSVFSSLAYHRVNPIKSGKRLSLVGWVSGNPFS